MRIGHCGFGVVTTLGPQVGGIDETEERRKEYQNIHGVLMNDCMNNNHRNKLHCTIAREIKGNQGK